MEKTENKALNLGKNKGAITQLENGKYRYSKMIITDRGKRTCICVTCASIPECIKRMSIKEKKIDQKKDYKVNTPLADAMYMWVQNVKTPTLVPQSIKSLKNTIKNQIEPSDIGHMRYQSVTTEELQSLINKLNLVDHYSKSTIKKTYDAFAWTVALAPADDPEIAVAVMLVQGKTSVNAAPVVREIIGRYGEKVKWEK